MATHYTIRVASLNGERFEDTIESDLKKHVESLALDPLFDLGHKIAVQRTPATDDSDLTTVHYFHNGRITVITRPNQYTAAQRQGRRRF